MVDNMKLKGIVKDTTLRRILHDATRNTIDNERGGVVYWTQKSRFLAKKRGMKFWEIYQMRGSTGIPERTESQPSSGQTAQQ